jgi:glycosyltransferase involved in cell wall biosynthesis
VSEELNRILVDRIRLDPRRVVTITNSIDLKAAAERAAQPLEHPWFAAGESPVILGIGRIAPQKNFSLLIKAFAQVRLARPSRLVIIGDGAGAELARLQELAAILGLTSADVWFAGHQSNPLKFLAHAGRFFPQLGGHEQRIAGGNGLWPDRGNRLSHRGARTIGQWPDRADRAN